MKLSQRILNQLIQFNHETGISTWKHRSIIHFKNKQSQKRWNAMFSGKTIGTKWKNPKSGKKYILLSLFGKKYRLHRVLWFMTYGEWPKDIDHINGDGTDNRILNLRNVTHKDNTRNQKLNKNNKTGIAGVSWCCKSNKWRVTISSMGMGYYHCFLDAVSLRKSLELKLNYHSNHGSVRPL